MGFEFTFSRQKTDAQGVSVVQRVFVAVPVRGFLGDDSHREAARKAWALFEALYPYKRFRVWGVKYVPANLIPVCHG